MRILKSHPLLKLVNAYLIDSSEPSNISYLWNFGSLLGLCLVIQIITGVTLAMHYSPNVLEAFNSVEHIMRDVNNGWLVRYLHSNTASAFFFLVYLHMGRGIYYGSYRAPRTLTWALGTVIFILMIGTAFLGYEHSPKWFNKNKNNKNKNNFNKRYFSIEIKSKSISDNLFKIINDLKISPIFMFENLKNEDTKQSIKKNVSNLSGVYMIVNKVTGDYYIGSAATNRFYIRFSNHLIHHTGSKIVKLAVKKYGLDNFAFLILDLYPNVVTKENNKELLDLEDKYLKLLLPNYNILTEAGSSFGYKHTEVDRIKMKELYNDIRREQIGSLNRGKKLSSETIDKMRKIALERPPMSRTTRLKCISNTRPVTLYNLNGTVYGKYFTIKDAANAINCNEKTIARALTTEKKFVKKQWIVKDGYASNK